MLIVVLIAAAGVMVGYLLRHVKVMQHINTTISLTICFMLFVLGISVGENREIVQHLWSYSGQGVLIAFVSMLGSAVGAWVVYRYIFKRKEEKR